MNPQLQALFAQFHEAAAQAQEKQDQWLLIDRVYEHMDELATYPIDQLLAQILQLVETYPQLDYGGPGPFGSLIEEHLLADYTPALAQSLQRQPSTQVIGWLDRAAQTEGMQLPCGPNPVSSEQYVQVLEQVLAHASASQECKEFAQICLTDARKFLER